MIYLNKILITFSLFYNKIQNVNASTGDRLRPFSFHEKVLSMDQRLDTTLGQVSGVLKSYEWNRVAEERGDNYNNDDPPTVETFYQIPYGSAERFEKPRDYPAWSDNVNARNRVLNGSTYSRDLHCPFKGCTEAWNEPLQQSENLLAAHVE